MKKSIFSILFVIALSLQISTGFCSPSFQWEPVKVDRVLDNQHVLLFDGRVIRIAGMTPPSLFGGDSRQSCFARPFFRLLKLLVENKPVQIRADKTLEDERGIFHRHVKLENGQNVAEFLLRKGKTKVMTMSEQMAYKKKYETAERLARGEKRGIWNGCGGNNELQNRLRQSGTDLQNTDNAPFLAPVSVGYVQKVVSGNQFVLRNGLGVKLLGVEIPSSEDARMGFSCFGIGSQEHLEDILLHKQVFLRRDISQIDEDGNLLRYVFLPHHDKRGHELFVNQQLILNGYGKHAPNTEDVKHAGILNQAQEMAYQNKRGAWRTCLQSILAGK